MPFRMPITMARGWDALIGVARSHDLFGVRNGVTFPRTLWAFQWKQRALRKKEGELDAERVICKCYCLSIDDLRNVNLLLCLWMGDLKLPILSSSFSKAFYFYQV